MFHYLSAFSSTVYQRGDLFMSWPINIPLNSAREASGTCGDTGPASTEIQTSLRQPVSHLDFQGQFLNSYISGTEGPINMERKGYESIGCYT